MSRLIRMMKEYVAANGKADLCKAAQRGERMIDRYLAAKANPPSQVRYNLARQCGSTHEEAIEIALEDLTEEARETA